MSSSIWLVPGLLLAYGAALDAEEHRHHALQVVWPDGPGKLAMAGRALEGPLVVAADVEHRLSMTRGWVVLVEPQSELGDVLTGLLAGEQVHLLTDIPPPRATTPVGGDIDEVLTGVLAPLWRRLAPGLTVAVPGGTIGSPIVDVRIRQLQQRLDACFQGDCLKPERWRAADVAADLALSEGRFLHLFRQQMGIAWRPWLLWRRLLCAVMVLRQGGIATDAAYVAGFSDSAHLSRTFRNTFGLTIRQALRLFG